MSFASTVARNTSWSEPAGSPWSRMTRIAYSELEHDVSSELTWSVAVSLSLSTTPSAVMLRTVRSTVSCLMAPAFTTHDEVCQRMSSVVARNFQ